MKKADFAAVAVVRKATVSQFTQHIRHCQQQNQPQWDDTWRRVRVTCPECEVGYLVPHNRGIRRPQCSSCDRLPLRREVFWKEKARITLFLVLGEDTGTLAPYILVDPKDRIAV